MFFAVFAAASRQIRKSFGERFGEDAGLRCTRVIRGIMILATVLASSNGVAFAIQGGNLREALQQHYMANLDQGPINLLSLALLPLCWQFVDFTMWQRLSGVDATDMKDFSRIRFGILRYGVETPVSWIFALVAGIAIRAGAIAFDPSAIESGISSIPIGLAHAATPFGVYLGAIVSGLFGAGVIAAMLSTTDTFIIGATSTFVYDLFPRFASAVDPDPAHAEKPDRIIRVGKTAAIAMVIVALVAYWIASQFGFDLISLLFGAYSAQLSLAASVIGMILLKDRAPPGIVAFTSILLGVVAGLCATIYALSDEKWALYPPLFSLFFSTAIYVFGLFLSWLTPRWSQRLRSTVTAAWTRVSSLPWRSWRFRVWLSVLICSGLSAPIVVLGLRPPRFWLVWQFSGLAFTLLYAVIMFGQLFYAHRLHPDAQPLDEILTSEGTGTFVACQIGLLLSLGAACWLSVVAHSAAWQLGCVVLATIFSLTGQVQIRDRPRLGQRDNPVYIELHNDARYTIRYSEGPALATFLILLTYVIVAELLSMGNSGLDPFVSGAESFQLLVSNIVFGLNYAIPRGVNLGEAPAA
jgi:hypothetical protein